MKKLISALLLAAVVMIGNGCVSRTVRIEPEQRGASVSEKDTVFGADPQSKLVDKKIVWIWQKEYRETR
jgi:hypothetical protein